MPFSKSSFREENVVNVKKERGSVDEIEKIEELLENTEGEKSEEILEKVNKFEVSKKDSDLEKMINDAKASVLKFHESLPPPPPTKITFEEYFYPELQEKKVKKSGSSITLASIGNSIGNTFGIGSENGISNSSSGSLSANFTNGNSGEDVPEYYHVGREMILKSSVR